jgi:chromosome segregation ATPase
LSESADKAKQSGSLQKEINALQRRVEDLNAEVEQKATRMVELHASWNQEKEYSQSLKDQMGVYEDKTAAAEFRAEGLSKDLKDANKEIKRLEIELQKHSIS